MSKNGKTTQTKMKYNIGQKKTFHFCTTLLLMLSCSGFTFAQNNEIPKKIQELFEGKWIQKKKNFHSTIQIKFEPNADYATFIEKGTGRTSPLVLKAYPQENQLVIPADMDKNDYLTMEIKNKTL